MDLTIAGLAFVIAALCAATMGFAIQRGATCTVAAVDEVISQHRATKLIALLEASLWVAGGLAVARQLQALAQAPGGYALTGWTVAGATLLGLGAFINRACVFGAIARLGSGEWAYVATPLGFYAGCLSVDALFAPPQPQALGETSVVLSAPAWFGGLVVALFALRLAGPMLRLRHTPARELLGRQLWSPHSATSVIGLSFLAMLLLAGAWAYTDVLAELARGMAQGLAARAGLLACLFGGALLGGWTAGRFRATRPRATALLRCFTGGLLMGWGSLLIPGSNDGLILVGMPLLRPYAWVAFATMCVVIASALSLQRWRAWAAPVRG